jgi:ubiquinone/menaquinone biosynthesis C-methylase UbiE
MLRDTCCVCGYEHSTLVVSKKDYEYVKCNQCGLIYVNLLKENNNLLYEGEYYFLDEKRELKDIARAKQFFSIVTKQKIPSGKLADVGCGIGFFLSIASKGGFETRGIDLSKDAIKYAKEKFGLNVQQGTLEDISLPADHFDVVTCWEVVEHLDDPIKFLNEIKRILKKDGLLFISTPNVESIYARLLKNNWHGFNMPQHQYHITYFCHRTVKLLFSKTEFKILSLRTIAPPQQPDLLLRNIARSLIPNGQGRFIPRLLKMLICLILFFPYLILMMIARWIVIVDSLVVFAKLVG